MIATLGPGGAEALVCDISREFSEMGAEVKLFLLAGIRGERGQFLSSRLTEKGIEIIGRKERKPASAANLLDLVGLLNKWKPDIVHCHLYNSEVAYSVAKLFVIKRPCMSVRTLHSTIQVGYRPELMARKLVSIFDATVPCSRSVESAYRDYFSLPGDKRIITVNNGCTLAGKIPSEGEKSKAAESLSLPRGGIIVSNIASFYGKSLDNCVKGHDILIRAFAACENPKMFLVFAGDGPLRATAQDMAGRLDIGGRVRFLGNIPEPWPLLYASDIYVMPSRNEGLPLALLEASSAGLPVIASDIPEIKKIAPENSWELFPSGDAKALAQALITAGKNIEYYRRRAVPAAGEIRRNYSLEACAGQYWEIFQRRQLK